MGCIHGFILSCTLPGKKPRSLFDKETIGLANKIHAYELQEQGLDTVQANEKLGFRADLRDYGLGAQILADLGLTRIRLITNNPRKMVGLQAHGLKVVERVPLVLPATEHSRRYLATKKRKLGHWL